MSTLEATITIDDATEGMVLSQALLDGGAVLLPAGATLSASSLNSLRRRGIEQLHVALAAAPVDQAALQAERERTGQRLVHLFRNSAGTGASDKLLERLHNYRRGEQ
jgi:hypothetical protein